MLDYTLVGKYEEKSLLEDQDLDGRLALKYILKKQGVEGCAGLNRLRIVSTGGGLLDTAMNVRVS
jgi:hypothetical protein